MHRHACVLLAALCLSACASKTAPIGSESIGLANMTVTVHPWGANFEFRGLARVEGQGGGTTLVTTFSRDCTDGQGELLIQGRPKERVTRNGPSSLDRVFSDLCRLGMPQLEEAGKARYRQTW